MIKGDEILAGDIAYVTGESTAGVVYLAYPSVVVPRFLVPLDDKVAQRFILRLMSADKGLLGKLLRVTLYLPGGLAILRALIFRERLIIKS
jgi:hypothetical protein